MTETIRKIIGKRESGTEFSIEFKDTSRDAALSDYFELESIVEIIETIKELRQLCIEVEVGLYKPKENLSNQMRTLCLAAAASYPNVLSTEFVEDHLEILINSCKVYANAKMNESRIYLDLNEDKGIRISIEGILWVKRILN
jgi:hypothetical protein